MANKIKQKVITPDGMVVEMTEEEMKKYKEPLNLHQKLIEIRKEVPYLKKDTKGFNYKYGKGSVLLGLLRPKMDELGVLLNYEVVEMITEDVQRQVYDKNNKSYRTVNTGRVKMKYIFKFTDAANPSSEIEVPQWFQGIGDDIQDIGGYNTYAVRYFLIGFFNIPTDEADPDAFENSVNKSRPVGLISEEQVKKIEDLINGHDDIRQQMNSRYKATEKIPEDQFDYVVGIINKLIQDKEKNDA
jgi:hypothetical protein